MRAEIVLVYDEPTLVDQLAAVPVVADTNRRCVS
jgi:hypothetical protein